MEPMRQSEAMEWVGRVRIAVQRQRARDAEAGNEAVAALLMPWAYGDRCILRAVATIEERGSVTPAEFANLMRVVDFCQPVIGVSLAGTSTPEFPVPGLELFRPWEPEVEAA